MANMLFANNANTTLASSLTNSATTMSVTSASSFPSPTGVQYFYCTLADAATQTTIEIVKVTSVTGTNFAITRAQDGTSATAFAAGAVVSLRLVRASLNDFPKLDETNTFNADQAISGQLTSSAGLATTGTFTATAPSDGLVMDYATGFGRFSAFAGDGFQWYNAGIANTKLMQLSSTGVITTATWNGATVGVAYGGTGVTSATGTGAGASVVLSQAPAINSPVITAYSTSTVPLKVYGLSGQITELFDVYTYNGGTLAFQINSSGAIATGTWNGSVIGAAYGGTGEAGTLTGILYGNGTSAHTVATTAQLLSGIGTLPVANGGTGLTSFTSNGIVYASSTSVLATGSALTFDGTNFATTGYASAASFRPTSSTNPVNGMYLPATNSIAFATNSTLAMYIDSGQNIAVGRITTPISIFTIKQVADTDSGGLCQIAPNSTNYWALRTGSDSNYYFVYNGSAKGQIANTTGAYSALSDANSKKDISDISLGLDLINKLRPVQYLMKDESEDSPKHLGFIAQEIQSLIPSSISEFSDGTLAMDKSEIIAVLVKAVQELNNKFDAYVASHP